MMDRDSFEEWLEDHRDEAMAHIEGERYPLAKWLSLYAKALKSEYDEESNGDEEEDEDGGELFFEEDA